MGDWRDIPNYDGVYQINREGQVRSWRQTGGGMKTTPKILRQSKIKTPKSTRTGAPIVYLTDKNGRGKTWIVFHLMVISWFEPCAENVTPYHKNGDIADNFLSNIAFTTKSKLGKMTGGKNNRKPIVKIDKSGKIVEVYPSLHAASLANYMSEAAIRERCKGIVKRPFAGTGYSFRYDD